MKTQYNKINRQSFNNINLSINQKKLCFHTPQPKSSKIINSCLLYIIPLFFLASCGVTTTNTAEFSQNAQKSIQKGMTKDQVRSELGNPVTVFTMNNTERWSYTKINPFNPFVSDHQSVTVVFNQSGRVTSVQTAGHRTSAGAAYGF